MRRIAHAGALLATLVVLLPACEKSSPTAENPAATGAQGSAATTSTQSCPQLGHPGGTILDKVTAPSPWGVAVRDDGLAYFTELHDGGVGITSTKTRTIDGFIPTGFFPTGIGFSPSGVLSLRGLDLGAEQAEQHGEREPAAGRERHRGSDCKRV
jgi:streptogramin lyase